MDRLMAAQNTHQGMHGDANNIILRLLGHQG